MTLPNKITIGRICLIPIFVMFALYYGRSVAHGMPIEWYRWAAIGVFFLAAASDGIDGYIARRYHQVSRLGVVLDPIADKGLLLSGLITLSVSQWQYEFPVWFPVLVISRDIIVVVGAVVMQFVLGEFKIIPTLMGKLATVAQMAAIVAVMLWPHAGWHTVVWGTDIQLLDLPVAFAGLVTLVSGLGYVRRGLAALHSKGHGEPRRMDEL
jgi:CDP-diacylglycerol--glycerol-3-phosphate 3-phosphatidyltransferase